MIRNYSNKLCWFSFSFDDVIVTAILNNVNWQTAVNAILTAFSVDNVASWTVPAVSYTIQKWREAP